MGSKHRRRFSREFKIEAIKLASQEGVAVSQIARDLGVGNILGSSKPAGRTSRCDRRDLARKESLAAPMMYNIHRYETNSVVH